MQLKYILTLYGIYNIAVGVSFIFMPASAIQSTGINPTHELTATHQIWGAALIGIGWISIKLRGADGKRTLIDVARGFIVFAALTITITVYHFWVGFAGPAIFMNVIVHLLTLIGLIIQTK